jgi:hypothetical protein
LPAVGRQTEQQADNLGHGVSADVSVVEHEGVAGIVAHGFDARDQLVVDDTRRAVFQSAHALVDQRHHVDQSIGHRRVGREADALGIDTFEADTIGVLILRIDSLRNRDHLRKNIELLRHAGSASKQNVDDFLEVEQPERQFQIARVQHEGVIAETAAVLIVHVEQEDAEIGARSQDFVDEQRNAARLADAGRAKHGEVLAEHFFDVDKGCDGLILLQRTDVDLIRSVGRVNGPELLIGDQVR